MPGVVQTTDDFLKSCNYHAEKRFRRHGNFPSVLWLTENATGHRAMFETDCVVTESVGDAELLVALADEMRADFAHSGVVRFCVAYLAKRVTVIRPLDPDTSMQPSTTKRQGVVIELHDGVETPVRLFRQIIRPPRGKPVLAAPVSLESADGPYDDVLKPATSCTRKADVAVVD